jgi:hypothetical protein
MRRVLLWVSVAAAAVMIVLIAVSAWLLRPAHVQEVVTRALSNRLKLDASMESVSLALLPRPRLSGRGLVVRVPGQPDLPPFIQIDHFSVDVGLLSMLRRHVGTVHAGGLKISVPPGDRRGEIPAGDGAGASDVIVDEFVTHDAELTFVPRKPGRPPMVFAIHDLRVRDIGFDRTMPFEAELTNPVPTGRVKATGTIGPWTAESATTTPVAGQYNFVDADLQTISGIGGTLNSTGEFSGHLAAIRVVGLANVPDFSLDLGGRPLPLTANFTAVVNGTDGTTTLEEVSATLLSTAMSVSGAITNLEGPGRRDVKLAVKVYEGRVEDILALVLDTPEPVMVGDIVLEATMALPPGPTRVRDRIALAGTFGLADTSFTDAGVQKQLGELSRRSQGKRPADAPDKVLSDLTGRFTLGEGRISLQRLRFEVPGATVRLNGTYGLATETLDFRGTLSMRTSVSRAVGGFRSIFLRPFDPLFRQNGQGSVVPIKITGPRSKPEFGLEMGRVFSR